MLLTHIGSLPVYCPASTPTTPRAPPLPHIYLYCPTSTSTAPRAPLLPHIHLYCPTSTPTAPHPPLLPHIHLYCPCVPPYCHAVCVPLDEVQEEWLSSFKGQQQLQGVARHFALNRDVFGGSPQQFGGSPKQSFLTVVYEASSPVHFGNVLEPGQVVRWFDLVNSMCTCVCVYVCTDPGEAQCWSG